jgi:AcrR family transcriptional regulator
MASEKASAFARGKRGNFDNRREEVLRAAARLFSEHGFRQATLEDVANALNVTRPALYHYARSKDELAIQCAERAREEIANALATARLKTTGREQMVAFFRRYAEIACADFGRFFVLVNEREFSPEMQEGSRTIRREVQDSVRRMVDAGVADGSLRQLDSADVARALFGAVNGIAHWYRPGRGRSPDQIAQDYLTMFLGGLAR